MLRIALATDSFLPVSGGVSRIVYEYATALAARGHESYVITPAVNAGYRGGYPFELLDYTGVRMPVAMPRLGLAATDSHYLQRADSIPFDVIHAHSPGSSGVEAARLAERLRVPLIGTFHPRYSDDVKKCMPDFYSKCDELWTLTREGEEILRGAGYRGTITRMPNGTDLTSAQGDPNIAKAAFHLSDLPILLCVGQIDYKKNLRRAIETAAELQRRNVPFQLLLAGQGPDENDARAYVRELKLSGVVRFLGHVEDGPLLSGLYAAAKLVLFLQSTVASGLIVHEAAAAGTPSVVIRGSAAAESVTSGVSGVACGDDAVEIADAVVKCLADLALLQAMGEAARRTIPRPWASVMDDVLARYDALRARERFTLKRKGLFRHEREVIDESLEKRMLDMAVRFLRQDLQNVYAYPYRPQVRPVLPERTKTSLPRATPESQGVSSTQLLRLYEALARDEIAQAQRVMVLRHGRVIADGSWAPYQPETPHQLYSASKSVTATAVGMLVDEGRLNLDERLADIFPDKAPANPLHPTQKLTVRHLLSMSTGSEFNELGTALGADWVREFLSASLKFEPGTQFDYNSLNTYMLAAIVKRKTGEQLVEYLHPRLLQPLGIQSANWDQCPLGTEQGGWGLRLRLEDLAKIGQLYLNGGVWDVGGVKTRLLSEDWVRAATRVQIETPHAECVHGYGHQIWMTPHPGGFLFNGMFGQYMLALPDLDLIVAVYSGTPRLFAQGNVMWIVEETLGVLSDTPLPESPAAQSALADALSRLTCRRRPPLDRRAGTPLPLAEAAARLNQRVYTFDDNICGLFPFMLMGLSNNFTAGLTSVVFSVENGTLFASFTESGTVSRVPLTEDAYAYCTVSLRQETEPVAVTAESETLETGEWMLSVFLHFLETPFTRLLSFCFREDTVVLIGDESPSVRDATAMLLDIAGVSKTQMYRSLAPVLRQERLQSRVRTFTTTSAQGKL